MLKPIREKERDACVLIKDAKFPEIGRAHV